MRILMLLILLDSTIALHAQYPQVKPKKNRVNDHRTNQTYNRFIIDSLRLGIHDAKREKALSNQGIIGNDFYQDFEIGMAQADNVFGTPTDYQPIDGFKRTLTGKLIQLRFSDYVVDDDLNFIIEVDSNHHLLKTHKQNISNRKIKKNNDPYRNWNAVFGEIDIFDSHHKFYKEPYSMPKAGKDSVSLYGPWVIEVFDDDECCGHHDDFHEIHPAEQAWWVTKNDQVKTYNLMMANDASKRFNDRGDFTEWGNTKLKNFWVNTPLKGVFAISFTIRPGAETLLYKINHITESGVTQTNEEPRFHYLIHKKDTLIKIEEVGKKCVAIDFENVGLDAILTYKNPQSRVVSGFLLLKSTIYREEGNLKLEVVETKVMNRKVMENINTKQINLN